MIILIITVLFIVFPEWTLFLCTILTNLSQLCFGKINLSYFIMFAKVFF